MSVSVLSCTPGANYSTHTLNHREISHQLQWLMMLTLLSQRPAGSSILCLSLSVPLSVPPAVPRCFWQYTSVTMTSILLRFLLPRRRCAGMWWSCARSRGRQTATCPRCGVDLVSNGASPPGVIFIHLHTMMNMRLSVTCRFVYGIGLYPKGQQSLCRHLFVFLL